MQGLAASLLLPPLALVLLALGAGLLAWRGRRRAGALAALAALGIALLGMPIVSAALLRSLDAGAADAAPGGPAPAAIIVLGADLVHGARDAPDIGPLTLERLRAGAALHRATGLPVLVTGGPQRAGEPALAVLMARSLAADFGVPVRWTEDRARDTRDNAAFSAATLRGSGIAAAHLVTHAWHLPRAAEAFAREGFPVVPAPLRREPPARLEAAALVPRPDHLAASWFALREWAGRAVYALRDGRAPPAR